MQFIINEIIKGEKRIFIKIDRLDIMPTIVLQLELKELD